MQQDSPKPTLFVGVDPGESTGVVALLDGKKIMVFQGEPREALIGVELLMKRFVNEADIRVTIERFIQQSNLHMSHQPMAQQVVGSMTALVESFGVPVTLQGAADAKACATDADLKRTGLWISGPDVGRPDANDARMAMRHALLCMSRHKARLFRELMQV